MAAKRHITEGSEYELFIDEKHGWVPVVCSYASRDGSSFILDTQKHGRYSMSDSNHPDIRDRRK